MKYLLDANTCIRLLNADDEAVTHRYAVCRPADIVLCSVVKAELACGARRSARVEVFADSARNRKNHGQRATAMR